VWREEWQGALDGADRALSEDMRALTAAPGEDWTELMILCQCVVLLFPQLGSQLKQTNTERTAPPTTSAALLANPASTSTRPRAGATRYVHRASSVSGLNALPIHPSIHQALHVCSVTKGSKGLLAILLTLGADMALKTKLGNSALHLAACAVSSPIVH